MRRLLAALVLAFAATTVACSDDSEIDNTCRVERAGVTELAPSCNGAKPAGEVEPLEAYRLHTARATSAAGRATRLADGVVNAVAHCLGAAIGTVIADVFVAAFTGRMENTPVTCDDIYAGEGRYEFADGTYTFYGQQRGGTPDSPVRTDTAARSTLRVFLRRDAGAYEKGDLVTVDVHRVDSFLVGARIVVDDSGAAAIAYDRTGPLVELLGQGATPPNPLKLTDAARTELANAFEIEGSVHADLADCGQGYRTVTDLTIPRTPANGDVKPVLVSSVLTAPGVRVEARTWDATHVDADVTGIDGVRGARVDLADATLTLECAP